MRKRVIQLFQLGTGNVGQAMFKAVKDFNAGSVDIELKYLGFADSKTVYTDQTGIAEYGGDLMQLVPIVKTRIEKDKQTEDIQTKGLPRARPGDIKTDLVVIDLTASDETSEFLVRCADLGAGIVLANKKPLVISMELFNQLNSDRLGCRATVGAGLPIFEAIRKIHTSGGHIIKAEGCFSGTLGTMFTSLERGKKYSKIIQQAHKNGYTEPDPREDLSGMDVARKILIIARMMGMNLELNQIQVESLYPDELSSLSVDQFISKLQEQDKLFKEKVNSAKINGNTLRYTATIEHGTCRVGLKEVPGKSPIGQLKGAGKIMVLETGQQKDPIVIEGAGAGGADTARDIMKDILEVSGAPT